MRWCRECVLPDTRPNLTFDEAGVCSACRNHGARAEVDWESRRHEFAALAAAARRSAGDAFDCIVPVSGGKDSTWQIVTCLEHGLRPLAVTWRTPGRNEIGAANLANLVELGVDHMDVQINPKVERRFVQVALERFGNPAIPMHLALFNIPLSLAARYRVPLVVWGENSAMEYGGESSNMGFAMDDAWLRVHGVSAGTTADDWESADLSRRDLALYRGPTARELEDAGVSAVFLGWYFPWDVETSLAVAEAVGFRRDPRGPRTGLYDYADIDDDFIAVHHHLKWYKFGFTRLFDNLAVEIRNGRMTRADAIETIRARGDDTPRNDIEALCRWLGIPAARFYEIADRFRSPLVWERQRGVWTIPGFIVDDWAWT